MYFFIGLLVALCLVFVFLQARKRPAYLKRICCCNPEEKCRLLQELIEPSGFDYEPSQDIFISRVDAWQRHFGYCAFFDRTAPLFQMVFDCEPIYFDYDGQTWLLELWKGQYGINTGCEAGIYAAGRLLSPDEREKALYQAVSDTGLLPMRISLYRDSHRLFTISRRHWWLAGFSMGLYSEPARLKMVLSVTFPSEGMLCACVEALRKCGYGQGDLCVDNYTVTICFQNSCRRRPSCRSFVRAFSQWKNRLFCRLYLLVTRPFTCNLDRLLYLYCFLPFAFRKTVCIRKPRKRRRRFT